MNKYIVKPIGKNISSLRVNVRYALYRYPFQSGLTNKHIVKHISWKVSAAEPVLSMYRDLVTLLSVCCW